MSADEISINDNPAVTCDSMLVFNDVALQAKSELGRLVALVPEEKQAIFVSRIESTVKFLEENLYFQYNRIPEFLINVWSEVDSEYEDLFCAALLATLISGVQKQAFNKHIPVKLLPETLFHLQRVVEALKDVPAKHMRLNNDIFLKDLGICRLEVFPCVALIVEKNATVSRRLFIGDGIGQMLRVATLAAVSGGRFSPYFEIHAHKPMLNHFNPEGWTKCYHLIAELLGHYPEYRGLIGGSWFFDPEVARISPHLAYLRQIPLEGGASFFRYGSSQADINNALAKSETRRVLFEEGRYQPTCYCMIWPKDKLLRWNWKTSKNS